MSDDVVPEVEADASVCFPVQDAGFSYRKSYKRINKKLTGAIASRLKTNFTRALLKENACGKIVIFTHDRVTISIQFTR